jgi:hypothetical protein
MVGDNFAKFDIDAVRKMTRQAVSGVRAPRRNARHAAWGFQREEEKRNSEIGIQCHSGYSKLRQWR